MKHSRDTVSLVQKTLSSLGEIHCRALFGGYGLSVGDATFGMVVDGLFYLRMSETGSEGKSKQNFTPLIFIRRGRAISLHYYLVDDALWNNTALLRQRARLSLESARRERAKRESEKRMKDLPNLTLQIETLLCEVGICNIETLRACGARESWLRLRQVNKNLGLQVLYALEGALTETHAAALPADTRQALLEWFNQRMRRLHS